MDFSDPHARIYVPGGGDALEALIKTTDLCVAAHQDDIEIMAYGPIAACLDEQNRFFTGCVVSDGAGSPRSGPYADFTDEQMKAVRVTEQENAARIGGYAAQAFLNLPSSIIKDCGDASAVRDIAQLLLLTMPETVYTHNLADKHDTHVAVTLRVIEAIRRLPSGKRPAKLYAMEVWRGLDWLCDEHKTVFDTSGHPNLAAALLGVYDSQITGGKRYDSAALGRRLANATFFQSHETDDCPSITFALDMTEMIDDTTRTPEDFIRKYIEGFADEVAQRLEQLGTGH